MQKPPSRKKRSLLFILALIFLAGVVFLAKKTYPQERIVLVVETAESMPEIVVYDPHSWSKVSIEIPKQLQTTVSNNLGIWKAESLWGLSQQENKTGELVKKTLIKTIAIPITDWMDKKGNTSLTQKEKIALQWFKIKPPREKHESLSSLEVIKETEDHIGREQFIVRGKIPEILQSIFANEAVKDVEVKAANPSDDSVEVVARMVEILGGKVTQITTLHEKTEENCIVEGKKEVLEIFRNVLSCQKEIETQNDETVIILGANLL